MVSTLVFETPCLSKIPGTWVRTPVRPSFLLFLPIFIWSELYISYTKWKPSISASEGHIARPNWSGIDWVMRRWSRPKLSDMHTKDLLGSVVLCYNTVPRQDKHYIMMNNCSFCRRWLSAIHGRHCALKGLWRSVSCCCWARLWLSLKNEISFSSTHQVLKRDSATGPWSRY